MRAVDYQCSHIEPGKWERVTPDLLFPQVLVASFHTLPSTYRHPEEGGVVFDAPLSVRLVTRGEVTISSNGTPPKTVKQGELCVSFPGITHYRVSSGTSASIYQVAFFSAVPPYHQGVPFLPDYGFMPEKVDAKDSFDAFVGLYEVIINALISRPSNFQSVTTAKLIDMINMIFSLVMEKEPTATAYPSRWCRVIGELEAIESTPNIRELAGSMGMSPDHFIRQFKQFTGSTPGHYYQQNRLWKAQQMLLSGKPVKETAFACGFSSQSYFSKLFKKYMGVTPSDFRKSDRRAPPHPPALPISTNFYVPGMTWQKLRVPIP